MNNKEMGLDMNEGEGIRTAVDVLLLNDAQQVLLGLRKAKAGEGTWGLPGGHQKTHETILETAARELKEELGESAEFELTEHIIAVRQNRIEPWFVPHLTVIILGHYRGGEIIADPEERTEAWAWHHMRELPESLFSGIGEIVTNYQDGKTHIVTDWRPLPGQSE